MFSPIMITRMAEDGLSRTVYWFWTDGERLIVYLNEVNDETRPTKRHGWKGKTVYSRIYNGMRQSDNVSEPDIPEDVSVEAVNTIRSMVVFQKWSRG
jgi:hypothetical protein